MRDLNAHFGAFLIVSCTLPELISFLFIYIIISLSLHSVFFSLCCPPHEGSFFLLVIVEGMNDLQRSHSVMVA